jgi:hypothetical protein
VPRTRKRSGPAAVLAAAALVTTCAACAGSAPRSGHATAPSGSPASQPAAAADRAPATPPPAGSKWAGSAVQGIWVAIPQSWLALDLARVSLRRASLEFATTGMGNSALRADLATLTKEGALVFADPASDATSAHGFTTNATALCQRATGTGSPATMAGLQTAMRAEYAQIRARVLSVTPALVSGGQAFAARLAVTARAGYTITELQVVALSGTGRTCIITFSTDDRTAFLPAFDKAAATIHVG